MDGDVALAASYDRCFTNRVSPFVFDNCGVICFWTAAFFACYQLFYAYGSTYRGGLRSCYFLVDCTSYGSEGGE